MKPLFLGLITARGGSKGIPGKNVAPLAGKPLIAWTIEAALHSRCLSRVIVSTDDREIAEVSKKFGAEVPFMRPGELSGDDSPHMAVVLHAIQWLEDGEGWSPDYVVLLQPTSPFRTAEDIDAAAGVALDRNADSVISVNEAPSHPYKVNRLTDRGTLVSFLEPPKGYLRRQTMPEALFENGAVYMARREVLLKEKRWYTENTYPFVMPEERSLDIDSPWDLELAGLILQQGRNAGKSLSGALFREDPVKIAGVPDQVRRGHGLCDSGGGLVQIGSLTGYEHKERQHSHPQAR